MHLIFVGAHPDDETYASGTIARHVAEGGKATIVVATRGSMGHWKTPPDELAEVRTAEMERAAKILGADLEWLDYADASIPASDEVKETIVDVYRRLKPDLVVTWHPLVWRDDHRRVGLAACDAALKASLPFYQTNYPFHRPEPEVYLFGEPMAPIQPNAYVDVTKWMDVKRRAFLCHASQWASWETDGPTDPTHAEKLWAKMSQRFAANGATRGVGYAEAFIARGETMRAPWLLKTT